MKKILVIEDNESNRYMIRFLLEKAGFAVFEAATGQEGIDQAFRHQPDCIIVDIQLPDINGLEVTQTIRASPLDGVIPILALTSYAMPGDRDRALRAGCTGYIEKPIAPERFIGQIQAFLGE